MTVPKALTIAGSDSGGGAGIQADLKTFSAFRVFGMSVLTAITAQNSVGVQGVFNLPPEFVARQLDSVLDDFGADAVKIGMLSTAPIVGAVADRLRANRQGQIVLDPVMIAKSGDPLLQPDAQAALVKEMLPLAQVVTPNLHEAGALAGMRVATEADMEEAARRILALGPKQVLVKGGHLPDAATDILWNGRELTRFTAPRLASTSTHGTGCTFSAAAARRRHPGGEGLRDGGDPRGLPGGPGRGRAPPLRDGLVGMASFEEAKMSFMEHLGELRVRIVRSLVALLIGLVIAFPFSQQIMDYLARPARATGHTLVFLALTEAFWVQMKVALIVGLFIAAPGILWQVWAFIAPGLHAHEKKYAAPFVIVGSLLFLAGGAFALKVVTPFAIQFLLSYERPGLQAMISIGSYVDFLLKFTLAFGLIFELPLAITLVARMGLVTAKQLAKNRKYAVLGAFIAAAVLTPTPDMFNQALMAGPLIILYEVGIVCARIFGKKPKAAPAPEPAA